MTMTSNQDRMYYNVISWTLQLLSLTYKYKQLFPLIQNRDFNGLVLHGICVTIFTANIVNKLNLSINNMEMVRLINGVLYVNS